MKRVCLTLAVAVSFLLVAPAALADGTPDLKVSTWEGAWKESEIVRTRGQTRDIYLRLKNESDGDGDTEKHTFTLSGPTGDTDWDVDYYHNGSAIAVPYDIEMTEGDTATVKVEATPESYPDAFLWGSGSQSNAFKLVGNGATDRAHAVVIVPGDLSIQEEREGTWVGENIILDPEMDIWGSTQQAPYGSSATEGAAVYRVVLHNVKNATVSYRIRTHKATGSAAMLQVCWRTDADWRVLEDITSDVTSASGYKTGYLKAGAKRYFKLYVLPVGSQDTVRSVAVQGNVLDIDGLDGMGDLTDLVPITAYLNDLPPEGSTFDLYCEPKEENLTPGNFGLMDFDGGSNPTGEIEDWLINRADISIPKDQDHVWIYGSPGYRSATGDEIQSLVGKKLNVPVATGFKDTGSTSMFKMKGYAQVVLTSFNDGDPAKATFEWLSFFQMPMLTEAVICNTGRAEGLALGPWQEIRGQ